MTGQVLYYILPLPSEPLWATGDSTRVPHQDVKDLLLLLYMPAGCSSLTPQYVLIGVFL